LLIGQEIWDRVLQVYDAAQACGAASSTETKTELIIDRNVEYVVRVAKALASKPKGPPNDR